MALSASTTHPIQLFSQPEVRVGVMGLGYVGLPVVREFCSRGVSVVGFDIDAAKIAALGRGESYLRQIPGDLIAEFTRDGLFAPTSDFSRLAHVDAIIICVPTPLGDHQEPDLGDVIATAESIAQHLRVGQLVVLQSTTYPGTTDEVVRPILEKTGLVCGRDFFLAFSPEREDPGRSDFSMKNTPKLVGGVDPLSQEAARALFAQVLDRVIPVASARVAEASKILENVYRCVNIAMVNELKMLFDRMGLDIWDVIDAAKTKPFGFQPFYPGPGLGGHCIPIDPFYLTWKAKEYDLPTRFIELAGEINHGMPEYVVHRLVEGLNDRGKASKGAKILILGVAYKKDVSDCRETPAIQLVKLLRARGADVAYSDPLVPRFVSRRYGIDMTSEPLDAPNLASKDVVLIATDHSSVDYGFVLEHSSFIVDTRNALRAYPEAKGKILKA